MSVCALIVAAGKAVRFGGDIPKQYLEVCGRPLLAWTISRFEAAGSVDRIVLAVAEDRLLSAQQDVVEPFGFSKVDKIINGGSTRQESVFKGLHALPTTTEVVLIHDGARPLVAPEDIDKLAELAAQNGAAMLAARAKDTVKEVDDGKVVSTLKRELIYLAQTPQAFRYDLILSAHEKYADSGAATDDAALLERQGKRVLVLEPTGSNLKVTSREDLMMAEAILKGQAQ